jgi:hypothetical protein
MFLHRLVSISQRLRTLFLQTPKLSNYVRSTWSLAWIDHCLRQAQDSPLVVIVFLDDLAKYVGKRMEDCLPRVFSLNVGECGARPPQDPGQDLMKALTNKDLNVLSHVRMLGAPGYCVVQGMSSSHRVVGRSLLLPAATMVMASGPKEWCS